MTNGTYLPCDILKPYVKAFTISVSAVEKTYTVLPDTGVVMGFQFRGKLSRMEGNAETRLAASGVTGLRDAYRVFRTSPDIGTVLVTFKEGGAAMFFEQPIHELFRESISLDNFMLRSELLSFEEQLCEAETDLKRIKVVEKFLIGRMHHRETDKLVATAIALIYQRKGDIRIRELMDRLNISQSPLEKRFRQVVGASPKKFASIVRFKHTLANYNPADSLTTLGYEAGFYDQAHFVKEFRNFTGESPQQFFSKR